MKTHTPKTGGFTLVELLVVISIITVLAGLTVATMDYAQSSAARNRAKAEISGLSVAIESYKIDNGDYPRDASTTDVLDAKTNTDATSYKAASLTLYKALSGDTDGNRGLSDTEKAAGRVYFAFKPNMLYPRFPAGSTVTVTALIDPFRNAYGYSTIQLATADSTKGYNPTFDLWSTAGTTGTNAWVTNW